MVIKRIDYDKCTGCSYPVDPSLNTLKIDPLSVSGKKRGSCTEACPMDVLRMDEMMHKPVIRYPEDCMTCYNCEISCPRGAISVDPIKKPIVQVLDFSNGEISHE
jgi:NAD-dependent dihydropyrimidine dehydrogenase PreA subunit